MANELNAQREERRQARLQEAQKIAILEQTHEFSVVSSSVHDQGVTSPAEVSDTGSMRSFNTRPRVARVSTNLSSSHMRRVSDSVLPAPIEESKELELDVTDEKIEAKHSM